MSARAREQARDLRRAREAAENQRRQRRRLLAGGGGVIIVGLLVAIVVSLVNAAGRAGAAGDPAAAGSPLATVAPAGAMAGGALPVGQATAPVRLEVFLDYMCPFCGRFEGANGAELQRLVADGTVRLELHPLAFLDRMSNGSRYSTRTANAIATVADRAPDTLLAFNQALFARQPKEGTSGLSDEDIAAVARTAGVPADVIQLFPARTFEPWVLDATDKALGSGVNSTPTVRINGTTFTGDLYTVGPLTQAITSAKAG